MNHSMRWIIICACFMGMTTLPAFEVTKNVNSGKPPVENVLLFAKGQPSSHILFAGEGNGKLSFAEDGAIVSTITGSGAIAPRISWKSGDGRPASFDTTAYTYLIFTCRLEGNIKETNAKGKVTEKRADNLWFSVNLYNAAGERVGAVSLADINDGKEGVTPVVTTELRIPLMLFTGSSLADKMVTSIGTDWKETAANQSRDFRWVIDRIALAN